MNKKVINLLMIASLTTIASEASSYHFQHFDFGPEWMELRLHTHVKSVDVDGKKDMAGIRFSYEYRKPSSFYTGADLLLTIRSHGLQISDHGQAVHSPDQPTGFGNMDLRLGYTCAPNQQYLTPFLGTGVYSVGTVAKNRGFHEEWLYLSGGMRTLFFMNDLFSLGLNLKAIKTIVSYAEFKNHNVNVKTEHYPWGGEIGVPFVWSFNPQRSWTFQLEPYWTNLDFSGKVNVFGSKFLIGAHF
jgi:hypothetical protein